jgi:ERCC4-type nuclease
MIFVDKAVGSNTLVPLLAEKGLPVEAAHLEWADVEFVGRGVKGEQVLIGIECKRLSELTGDWDRFAGEQVTKMNREYAHRYLVFEGEWQQNKKGVLFQRTGRMSFKPLHGDANASRLRKKLITLEMCAGFHVQHINTHGRKGSWSAETVRYIHDLYRWWTDDDMDQHKSHIVNYQAQGLIPLNKYEHAFAAWPGLSSKRAKPVSKKFHNSIRLAASASAEQWAGIEVVGEDGKTRKLGTKLADDLVKFLNGESE